MSIRTDIIAALKGAVERVKPAFGYRYGFRSVVVSRRTMSDVDAPADTLPRGSLVEGALQSTPQPFHRYRDQWAWTIEIDTEAVDAETNEDILGVIEEGVRVEIQESAALRQCVHRVDFTSSARAHYPPSEAGPGRDQLRLTFTLFYIRRSDRASWAP